MRLGGESELLARCLTGDAEAWNVLFDEHYGPATRFIFQLAPDFSHEDVEEVAQEVFVTVVKHLHTFQGHSAFQTWLFRIAANKARDYRQHLHAAKRGGGIATIPLHQDPKRELPPPDPPSPQPGPDLALLKAEQISMVGEALVELGGPCQEIIELRYFADLSYEEISATLELNAKTVSSRLSKCLDKLETITRQLMAEADAPGKDPKTSRENKTPTSV
jgi:RNA polymerase sigma-70 factor (ECF subfamily)